MNDGTDTSFFGDNYLATTATPGVFEALAVVVAERFEGHAFLVSSCGQRVQDKSMEWLDHHDFYTRTGVPRTSIRFCRRRAHKAPLAKELGITHFIDDRMSVLRHLLEVPHRVLFSPDPEEYAAYQLAPGGISLVWSWKNILDNIESLFGQTA